MSLYLFDTGPLLCAAANPAGPDLLKARYAGNAAVLLDVDRELRGLRSNASDKVARAAARACKAFGWMQRVEADESLFDEISEVRDLIVTFRTPPKGDARRDREDWADAAQIVSAKRAGPADHVLVMNDTPARRAARARGVSSISTGDILRALRRDGTISQKEAIRFCETLRPELDAGEDWTADTFR